MGEKDNIEHLKDQTIAELQSRIAELEALVQRIGIKPRVYDYECLVCGSWADNKDDPDFHEPDCFFHKGGGDE